jgi:predicted TPR repeat methyltransferase
MSYRRQEKISMATQPLFVSSGDLVADQRYRWALDYLKRGDVQAAADILAQVIEVAPGFATAWFALATIREKLGDRAGAIEAFQAARDSDREDYHGARLHLARLGAGEATPSMTATYVRRLFDQHAPEFEQSLVERLGYCGPALLMDSLVEIKGTPLWFGSVLDLGCGTGLAGAAIRPFCESLSGVDLSPAMIEQAGAKGIYDRLVAAELVEFLVAEAGAQHHLVLAADVFVYCSDLMPVVAAAGRVLAPGGLFAFTVERHDGSGIELQPTLRYAHSAAHVRAAIEAASLRVLRLAPASTRREGGNWVAGLVVVASAPPASNTRSGP